MGEERAAGRPEILDVVPDGRHHVVICMPVPELFMDVGQLTEAVLASVFGRDNARIGLKALQDAGSTMCVGGWAPYAKMVNSLRAIQSDIPRNNWDVSSVHFGMFGNDIAKQRNAGVEQALMQGADYIWFQDYDVLNPVGAFGSLYGREVEIVSGVYWMKEYPPRTMCMAGEDNIFFDRWWRDHGKEVKPGVTYEIGRCYGGNGQITVVPCGCLLVKTEVFKHIEPPWFKMGSAFLEDNRGIDFTDDAYFCQKAREAGYELYLDTAVLCEHMELRNGCVFGMNLVRDEHGRIVQGQPSFRFVTERMWRPWTDDSVEVILDDNIEPTEDEAPVPDRGEHVEALAGCDAE